MIKKIIIILLIAINLTPFIVSKSEARVEWTVGDMKRAWDDLRSQWEPKAEIPYCLEEDECGYEQWVKMLKRWVQNVETEKDARWFAESIISYILGFIYLWWTSVILYSWFGILKAWWDEEEVKKSKTTITYVWWWMVSVWAAHSIIMWLLTWVLPNDQTSFEYINHAPWELYAFINFFL